MRTPAISSIIARVGNDTVVPGLRPTVVVRGSKISGKRSRNAETNILDVEYGKDHRVEGKGNVPLNNISKLST